MIDLSDLYYVYRIHHHGDDLHYMLAGKFLLTSDSFHVLEDHTGFLVQLETATPKEIHDKIKALAHNSMYWKVASFKDIKDGHHPELIPVAKLSDVPPPESVFEYRRLGMPDSQELEFVEGKAFLDGHPLEDQDLQLLLDNVQQGHASIQYRPTKEEDSDGLEKMEGTFMSLAKIEPELDKALQALRQATKSGQVDPHVLQTLSKEIFTDSMVRRMGNKKAYADFLSRPKQGVHIRMDGNDFGTINKLHGFETGNQAIVAMGNAMREAMDESVGSKHGKLFRIGGDEFEAFVPSHEHAALFLRALRQKLEAIPPVGGTHNLSVSMGFGHSPEHAEGALIQAKGAKKAAGYKLGQAKTHAHSALLGSEGPVPTGPDQLGLKPLAQEHPQIVEAATQHIRPAPPPTQSVTQPAEVPVAKKEK